MSDTAAVSAELTMKLRASTDYEANCSATITPEQWGDLNAVVHGRPTAREKQMDAENAALHQDLSFARTGWEQATEAVREADEVREKLVAALKAALESGECGDWQSARHAINVGLAAAEAA